MYIIKTNLFEQNPISYYLKLTSMSEYFFLLVCLIS